MSCTGFIHMAALPDPALCVGLHEWATVLVFIVRTPSWRLACHVLSKATALVLFQWLALSKLQVELCSLCALHDMHVVQCCCLTGTDLASWLTLSFVQQAITMLLQNQMGLATDNDRAQLAALREAASHRYDGTRDLVGMRKQVVAATDAGALFALHSGNGRVLWRAQLDVTGLKLAALVVAKQPHRPDEDIEVCCRICMVLDLCRLASWLAAPAMLCK